MADQLEMDSTLKSIHDNLKDTPLIRSVVMKIEADVIHSVQKLKLIDEYLQKKKNGSENAKITAEGHVAYRQQKDLLEYLKLVDNL